MVHPLPPRPVQAMVDRSPRQGALFMAMSIRNLSVLTPHGFYRMSYA
jgi:hypothetical protein